MTKRKLFLLFFFLSAVVMAGRSLPLSDSLVFRLQSTLDSIVLAEGWPGMTLAVELPGGQRLGLASGWADREERIPMTPEARMLVGSVGKIFVAPLVLQLVAEQNVDLNVPVRTWLGGESWFRRLPNAEEITLRMLLNHTSGLPRYVFSEGFLAAAKADPMKEWRPEELLSFIFDAPAVHQAGKGWAYSDTNYILLGILIERWTGQTYYQVLEEKVLRPFTLNNTFPSTQPELPGLTQGYIGEENFMDLPSKVVVAGKYAMNPQFEWTGGGLLSNVGDLAYWLKQIHEGEVIPANLYQPMISPVDFRSGAPAETGYGLGTFVWPTPYGPHYGHAGLFMGYLSIAEYSPRYGFSIALQTNTDATLGRSMHRHVLRLSNLVVEVLTARFRADEAAVLANFKDQEACWNNKDIDCYLRAYHPSANIRTISGTGLTFGWEAIARQYKENWTPENMGRLSFEDFNLDRLRPDLYFVTGRFNLQYEDQPTRSGYFSVLMQKTEGKWYMVTDHSG